ncbi:MAG TPA: hypothetical protein VHC22_34360 [Pirellulales bacterium]|nr:hypothetical protein [Pirellulales bacterium]
MADRRSLVAGIKPATPPVDPSVEKDFIYRAPSGETTAKPAAPATTANIARSPLSTRIRADFAAALKRASLERQLEGKEPNTLCDILEQAIEPWLRTNGYIT